MALLVLIADMVPQEWEGALARLEEEHDVRIWPYFGDPSEIRYALVWQPPEGALTGFPNLQLIFSLGAGVDHLLRDPGLPDVPIVRFVAADLTRRMSEYVVQHVLMHHRRQAEYAAQQRDKIWRVLPQPSAGEVRVGVMGFGVLGQDAAHKLKILGFDVAGWSRTAKEVPDIPCYAGDEQRNAFLARTDILVCLLPLTTQTRGILNRSLFSRLARNGALPGPVLINAGRGGLQSEEEIVAALASGELWAASLDVFSKEPLPASSPLWEHPRVHITPHNAAVSDPGALANYVLAQIRSFEAGQPLENVVDREREY